VNSKHRSPLQAVLLYHVVAEYSFPWNPAPPEQKLQIWSEKGQLEFRSKHCSKFLYLWCREDE